MWPTSRVTPGNIRPCTSNIPVGCCGCSNQEPDEPLAAEVSSQLFDSSSHLFRNTLMFCSALLGVGLILGVGYEFFYHRKHLARVASGGKIALESILYIPRCHTVLAHGIELYVSLIGKE